MPSGQFSHFRDKMSLARVTGHRESIPGRSRPFRDGWQTYSVYTCIPTKQHATGGSVYMLPQKKHHLGSTAKHEDTSINTDNLWHITSRQCSTCLTASIPGTETAVSVPLLYHQPTSDDNKATFQASRIVTLSQANSITLSRDHNLHCHSRKRNKASLHANNQTKP